MECCVVIEQETRFAFGKNWKSFVDEHFDQSRVDVSKQHMLAFLALDSLEGKTFLDIGCGSGLHSLAAFQSGATRILSFDFDSDSVATTKALHRFAGSPAHWTVQQGSALDATFMASLPEFDIVYSWGVLHHTGDVWRALRLALGTVRPGAKAYIALYSSDMHKEPPTEYWLDIKRSYVSATWMKQRWMELAYVWRFQMGKRFWRLFNVWKNAREYKKSRGMSFYHDIKDWLGGWPMEFCYDADVVTFAHKEFGLDLVRMDTGQANTEFLFHRQESSNYKSP
jgi:2-polyprenyl-6-hydroxyphenyl methylase/3-demethylubiquinone-9 3-methyltransferase